MTERMRKKANKGDRKERKEVKLNYGWRRRGRRCGSREEKKIKMNG